MAKEKFVLVSLQEDKAKKLAQVISNESCRKILDYLSEKEATESELSEKLGIPISTVHYNLAHLMDGGLVVADEFHYSPKGKEVNHYKLANKYIIIAPKSVHGIKEKLRSILPMFGLSVLGTGFVYYFTKRFSAVPVEEAVMAAAPALKAAAPVEQAMEEAAFAVPDVVAATPFYQQLWFWFLIGSLSAIVIYMIFSWRRKE